MVPDREVPRPSSTAIFPTILDKGGLNQNLCSDFSLTLHLGFSMGALPAQGTMPSSIGLDSVCKYGEKITHGFDKSLSQREPGKLKNRNPNI